MSRQTRYSPEVRERAVRMVFEHHGEYKSQWAAIGSIATKIGQERSFAGTTYTRGSLTIRRLECRRNRFVMSGHPMGIATEHTVKTGRHRTFYLASRSVMTGQSSRSVTARRTLRGGRRGCGA
jgi:hypothetical protein